MIISFDGAPRLWAQWFHKKSSECDNTRDHQATLMKLKLHPEMLGGPCGPWCGTRISHVLGRHVPWQQHYLLVWSAVSNGGRESTEHISHALKAHKLAPCLQHSTGSMLTTFLAHKAHPTNYLQQACSLVLPKNLSAMDLVQAWATNQLHLTTRFLGRNGGSGSYPRLFSQNLHYFSQTPQQIPEAPKVVSTCSPSHEYFIV